MKIQSIQSQGFGKVYYGTNPDTLTRVQKDVLADINYILEENNIVKKLEKLKYDVYIEPKQGGAALDVALLSDVRFDKSNKIRYGKIILLGSYADLCNKYKSLMKGAEGAISTDNFLSKINRFFRGYEHHIYKKFINYV